MAVFTIKQFGGISPKVPARYLADNQAQVSLNTGSLNTSLQPLQDVGATVHTLTKPGTQQTIYRFGQNTVSDSLYWFHWPTDVDVCRSQIATDVAEWTFYTGDGAPKATYNAIALSGSNYPTVSRPLGLPAPAAPCSAYPNTLLLSDYPGAVYLTAQHISDLVASAGIRISVLTDDPADFETVAITTKTPAAIASAINAATTVNADVLATAIGNEVKIETIALGDSALLHVEFDVVSVGNLAKLYAAGYGVQDASAETRIYTWTWVNKEAGFEFESAPAGPSNLVDVRTGQEVTLSGFSPVPGGTYAVTHRRIYRAVEGAYLYVGEIPAAQATYVDSVDPEDLGEEMLTTTWAEPPAGLSGLTNMANGILAGFVGRDVYMSDPYHPHAWPVEYINSVAYPIVGLGATDTTLAVLTTGTPYFIQGSHPETMTVVQSNLEQACASKRSIVGYSGAVIYASPDGLVSLSPAGSRVLTDQYFTKDQWQLYFAPTSIHAYQYENKYIAFYNNGSLTGGFVYDLLTGQFTLHSLYADAGYNDIQRDELFLAFGSQVKKWADGGVLQYTWKSKKFTLPRMTGFSFAQVEAELYPVALKLYADGALIHTQNVANRDPFRLPATPARDWELQVEGGVEVFSVSVAQSAEELANA